MKASDRTVIAAGTLASGRMIDAQGRGMVGKSGSMSFGVKQIQAVDGSWIAVDADLSSKGAAAPERPLAGSCSGDPVDGLPITITGHRFEKFRDPNVLFDIERDKSLGAVTFTTRPPGDVADAAALMATAELLTVDGAPVPVPVRPTATTATTMTFDAWSVIQFCRDGGTRVGFRMHSAGNVDYSAQDVMLVKVQKKVKKKPSGA